MEMAQALRQDLIYDNKSFQDGAFAYAMYDPPTTLLDRHNEVWVAAADDSASSTTLGFATAVKVLQSSSEAAQRLIHSAAQALQH
jgi:hypothetical protein